MYGQFQTNVQQVQEGQSAQVRVTANRELIIANSSGALQNSLWRSIDVAASSPNFTLQTLAGAAGDYLAGLTITPLTTSPGAVSLTNGSGSAIVIFAGGATSVGDLSPRPFPVGACSVGGPWKVTTGANVQVKASGLFS